MLVIAFCMISFIYLRGQAAAYAAVYESSVHVSLLDYLFHLVHGMAPISELKQRSFDLPVTYLGLSAANACLVGDLLALDAQGIGVQLLTRSGSRRYWMGSRVLWNCLAITCVYGIILVLAVLAGGGNVAPTDAVCIHIIGFDNAARSGLTNIELFLTAFGMAYLTSIAFGQLQMALELIFSPIAAFLAVMVLAFMSIYIVSPFLLGNCFMLQRNAVFLPGGIQTETGIAVDIAVIVISIAVDFYCIKRRDIL